MTSYGSLPYTGAASATLFGVVFDQMWLLVAGLLIVAIGVSSIRLGWRRGKSVTGA